MAEYIKRDAIKARMEDLVGWCQDLRKPGLEQALVMLNEEPIADVAPVVRCKDCKYRIYKDMGEEIGEIGGCALFNCAMTNDDFCSYGEKKDGGDAEG